MENFSFCAVIPLRNMIKTKGRTIFSLSFYCQNTGMSTVFEYSFLGMISNILDY